MLRSRRGLWLLLLLKIFLHGLTEDSFALPGLIGDVVANNVEKSLTKETLNLYNDDSEIGVGITQIQSQTGAAHTITTLIDHGLNPITALGIVTGGQGYGDSGSFSGDIYNAKLVAIGDSVTGSNASAKLTVTSCEITSVKIMDFGAFVTILPGKDGLVHISEISNERVEKVSDVINEGDVVKVKVLDVDARGKVKLSIKEAS